MWQKKTGFSKFRAKHIFWSSNFLNYKLSVANNLWNSNLILIFFYSSPSFRNQRKSGWILVIERESFGWIWFRPRKCVILVLINSFFYGKSLFKVFISLKLTWKGFSKFGAKHIFWSFNFLNYKLSVPKWNSNLILIFFILVLIWEMREKVVGFQW